MNGDPRPPWTVPNGIVVPSNILEAMTSEQWWKITAGQDRSITTLDIVVEIGDTKAVRRQKSIEMLLGQGLLQQLEVLQGGVYQLPGAVLGRAIGDALNLDPNDMQVYEASIMEKQQALQQQPPPVDASQPPQGVSNEQV
jgi:hypothetical protein